MIGVSQHFDEQAAQCAETGSPFTATVLTMVLDRLDRDTEVGRAILDWPGDPRPDALSLRVAGGLHGLVLSGESQVLAAAYPGGARFGDQAYLGGAIDHALREHGPRLEEVLASPPQTNEVARSAVLAGGFLSVLALTGRPLSLLEIGASGGLNLLWDHYRYDLGGVVWGQPEAALQLSPTWQGRPPPAGPLGSPVVVARAGCDHSPVDLHDPAGRLRLRSYIWADQADRLGRMDAAVTVAAQSDLLIDKADAVDWLRPRLAQRRDNAATVLFHSVVWQYLPAESKAALREMIAQTAGSARAEAPLAWLRMEADPNAEAAELRLTLWPGGDDRLLARACYHGRWVDWCGDDLA